MGGLRFRSAGTLRSDPRGRSTALWGARSELVHEFKMVLAVISSYLDCPPFSVETHPPAHTGTCQQGAM